MSTFIQCHHRKCVNLNVIQGCRTPNLYSLYRQTQERLRELESQWEVSKGELEKLEQLQEALGAAAQYRTELEVRLQDSNSALAQAQKQKADVQQALEDKCVSHEKLQQQLVDLGDQAAKREEGLSQECEDLRAQLVVAQTQVMEAARMENAKDAEDKESEAAIQALQEQLQDQQQLLTVAEVRRMSCFAPVLCVCRSFSKSILAWNGKRSRTDKRSCHVS